MGKEIDEEVGVWVDGRENRVGIRLDGVGDENRGNRMRRREAASTAIQQRWKGS